MRYWDTSAIVPLLVAESGSARARALVEADPVIATWAWTRVEIASAIERRARAGAWSASERREALARFAELADAWDEVTDVLAVRGRAIPLLARHPIRAADAAQLGAAVLVADGDPTNLPFVCFDARLAMAAEREGFAVLTD
jgi:hypothetical protein